MNKKNIGLVGCAVTLLLVASCSSNKNEIEVLSDPQTAYNEAVDLLNQSKYEESAAKFEALEREHPASPLAGQAEVKRAYAKYLDGKFEEAIFIVDDFVKQYPANTSASYMYYLKGLCYYDQIVDVGRDQELTYKAISAFKELISRFPDTSYSKDAKLKIEYAINSLAGKEMEIGRFYLNKSNVISALGRFKTVVKQYQTSIFTPEALYRLSEIYYMLGDTKEAQVYASILGYNYSESEWYQKSYALIVEHKSEDIIPWYKQITKIW